MLGILGIRVKPEYVATRVNMLPLPRPAHVAHLRPWRRHDRATNRASMLWFGRIFGFGNRFKLIVFMKSFTFVHCVNRVAYRMWVCVVSKDAEAASGSNPNTSRWW